MRGLWNDEYIGKRIGRRVVLERLPCPHGKCRVRFRCDCGEIGAAPLSTLLKTPDRKCKYCIRKRAGLSTTVLYRQWIHARREGKLALQWHDWDAFLSAVGGERATLKRMTRPNLNEFYGPNNCELKEL